jgi:hypothetical protein
MSMPEFLELAGADSFIMELASDKKKTKVRLLTMHFLLVNHLPSPIQLGKKENASTFIILPANMVTLLRT